MTIRITQYKEFSHKTVRIRLTEITDPKGTDRKKWIWSIHKRVGKEERRLAESRTEYESLKAATKRAKRAARKIHRGELG